MFEERGGRKEKEKEDGEKNEQILMEKSKDKTKDDETEVKKRN